LQELEKEFTLFVQRASIGNIEVIYTDNPKQDSNFLKKIFGPNVQVLRDLFHAIQDIAKRCRKKSPWFGKFLNEVSNCFFFLNKADYDREMGIQMSRTSEEDIHIFDKFWKRNHRIRKHVYEPLEIASKLCFVWDKYQNVDLYTSEFNSYMKSLVDSLENGDLNFGVDMPLLSPPDGESILNDNGENSADDTIDDNDDDSEHKDDECDEFRDEFSEIIRFDDIDHINVGTENEPYYITTRSTSQLECLHRWIVKVFEGHSFSAKTSHLIIVSLVYRWNRSKGKKFRNDNTPYTCFDPALMHDIATLMSHLGINPTGKFRYIKAHGIHCERLNNVDMESFGSARVHHASVALQARRELTYNYELKSFMQRKTLLEVNSCHVTRPVEIDYVVKNLGRILTRAAQSFSELSIARIEQKLHLSAHYYRIAFEMSTMAYVKYFDSPKMFTIFKHIFEKTSLINSVVKSVVAQWIIIE
jgi:hypothetical protein